MGLFRPYERSEDATSTAAPETAATTAKKQVPTPTRKEAEAARRERLNPTLSPAQLRARDRDSKARQREESWKRVDDEPGRVLLRNFIDSRKGMAQWWMPTIMSTLVLALVVMYAYPPGAIVATFVPYAALALLAVHIFILWRQFKVLLAQRLPNEPTRGLLVYLINRIIAMRRFRVPTPQVKPGDEI
ncbi:MAG: DUF3043 domain-containing protein [Propionibacteriales bacterium]|nr:DUF3043 domain-containing protein [Propionibacteriales bacterium]